MKWSNHNSGGSNLSKISGLRLLIISGIYALIVFLIPFVLLNCEKELKDLVVPNENDFPASPINVKAVIADYSIFLSWDMSDTTNIHCYHIYRKDTVATKMSLIDSSLVTKYEDNKVMNGKKYYYQIVAVNNQGYEGKFSQEVSARPNLFGVIIDNGNEYTNQKSVTLNLTAPSGTQLMSIANDSGFTNSIWETYWSIKTWTLTPGDGQKYVYIKFRDSDGNVTPNQMFDTIILDTKAVISVVTENTIGQTKVPGQNIHFSLNAGEPEGTATIDIGSKATAIKLFDDGTNGDIEANNGIYEIDYRIPLGFQILNAIITGHFTDRANNVAEDVTASGTVTIQQDPSAVTLYPPAMGGAKVRSLELYWSESSDDNFSSYRLFRKTSPGVDTASILITTIMNKATTNYSDQTASENIDYYYRVFVFHTFGKAKGSNEVMGRIDYENEKPSAVKLLPPAAVGNSLTSLNLTWSKNSDDDFESYRIYRAQAPEQVDSTSFVANIIYNQDTIRYVDTGLRENTEYNYQVYVFDTGGRFAGSNKVSGKTGVNASPTAVTLLTPTPIANSTTALTLNWSRNVDEDFASYRIYRAEAPTAVDSNSFMVDIIYDQNITDYQENNLKENTEYNYRIYVFDKGGKSTGSNMVTGKTNVNTPPIAVQLLTPTPVMNSLTSLNLSWSKNENGDFESYRIYRAEFPQEADSSSFLVNILYSQSTTTYQDNNLKENTQYNYRVYVFDQGGISAGSNMVTGKTNVNIPPIAVQLLTPAPVMNSLTSLNLSWSKNEDVDFESYRIYRAEFPQEVNSSSFLVNILYNQSTTTYQDNNLKENTQYNYRVYVFDKGGKSTGSNTVTGKTNVNEPPTRVTLLTPTPVGNSTTSLYLSWSQNADVDFASYRIYRAEAPNAVNLNSFVVDIIYNQNTTDYQDNNLKENTEYNYCVYVFDKGGKSAGSNTATGKTNANQPPTPVILAQPSIVSPTALRLSWSQNNDQDFLYYKIYRSETPPVDISVAPIAIISTRTTLQYNDTNLITNKTYYYRVFVTDQKGSSSGSNEASGMPH